MKRRTKAILLQWLGAVIGLLVFMFFYWLGGGSIPDKRGNDAVAYAVGCVISGMVGFHCIALLFWDWYYDNYNSNK